MFRIWYRLWGALSWYGRLLLMRKVVKYLPRLLWHLLFKEKSQVGSGEGLNIGGDVEIHHTAGDEY